MQILQTCKMSFFWIAPAGIVISTAAIHFTTYMYKSKYTKLMYFVAGDAVADGGSLPFNKFNPLNDLSKDELEKV